MKQVPNAKPRIRVAIADDNEVVRLGLAALLGTQADMEVVAMAWDGPSAMRLHGEVKPDVLLLDLKMPTLDGTQVIALLQSTTPQPRVLVLTHYDGSEEIFLAVRAGAQGFITKESPGADILAAIRSVHAGGTHLAASVVAKLNERAAAPEFTQREKQVLALLAKGLTNRQIAKELSLAERTCAIYVGSLLHKLKAKTRTEAVAIAQRRGLIRPAP